MSTKEIKRLLAWALKERKILSSTSSGARRGGGLTDDTHLKQVNMLIRNYRLELKRRASGDTSGMVSGGGLGNKGLGNKGLGNDEGIKGGGAGSPSAKSSGKAAKRAGKSRKEAATRARQKASGGASTAAEKELVALNKKRSSLTHAIGQARRAGRPDKGLRLQLLMLERKMMRLSRTVQQQRLQRAANQRREPPAGDPGAGGPDGQDGASTDGKAKSWSKAPTKEDIAKLGPIAKKIAALNKKRSRITHAIGQARKHGHSDSTLRRELRVIEVEIIRLSIKLPRSFKDRREKEPPPLPPTRKPDFKKARPDPIRATPQELKKGVTSFRKLANRLKAKTGPPGNNPRHHPMILQTSNHTFAATFVKDENGRLWAMSGKLVSSGGATIWQGAAKRRAL